MAQPASTSAAPEAQAGVRPGARIRPRLRLITPATTLGLAIVILAALLVLYPKRELLERVEQARRDDPLTVQYLINLHRKDPGHIQTTLLLAGARLSRGETAEALRLIAPREAHPDAAIRRGTLLMHAETLRVGPARAAFIAPHLGEAWTRDELMQIAGYARATQEPALRRAV